tara:strand:+ start:445 stop:594 length:150 start_codon:yes stop_codon:yes gene_type:complete
MMNLRYSVLNTVMFIIVTVYAGMSIAADEPLTVSVDRTWGLLLGDDVNV